MCRIVPLGLWRVSLTFLTILCPFTTLTLVPQAHLGVWSSPQASGSHLSAIPTLSSPGYNSTIMAYGQTGSGKTYTMFGPQGEAPSRP